MLKLLRSLCQLRLFKGIPGTISPSRLKVCRSFFYRLLAKAKAERAVSLGRARPLLVFTRQ